ncbi:small nuclear ribonucleoprotein [Halobacillus naozhouensis]|uniref:Small nuclear ribonucleoprotein n=1 Tax=Halobacillus naozhouensis TaxID=554880 RepID=A0ABY8J397_9BACI|nr:small nuclear ribonucleoprotein [Halobacillus naozhouensis]WFT76840.1 small nuclear ribonucleoprotein [Halobacillus naozhouensis]
MHNNNVHEVHYENQMYPGVQGAYQDPNINQLCEKYMEYHVIGEMRGGSHVEGIITDMDENNMGMLVPEEVDSSQVNRQFGYRRRYRRYHRRRFPYLLFRTLFPYPDYYLYYY